MPQPKSRKPLTREAALAKRANEYALSKNPASFGAPVSAQQIAYYEAAIKSLRKSKSLAQFFAFKSNDAALRYLRPVATGTARSSQLPKPTRDAFDALYKRLTRVHEADNRVNKTWPRKHAIVLVALLTEKPARKPRAPKPAQPQSTPSPVAA